MVKNHAKDIVSLRFVVYTTAISGIKRAMTSAAVVAIPLSKPKIHRLPLAAARTAKQQEKAHNWVLWSCLLLLGITTIVLFSNQFANSSQPDVQSFTSQDEVMTPALVEVAAATLPVGKSSKTIILSDQGGTIVGQMAKIPAQGEQGTEVTAVTAVDNRAARDLLSILNKY